MRLNVITFLLLVCCVVVVRSQPYTVINYGQHAYDGGTQNWAVSCDNGRGVYCANADGLLYFNGNDWECLRLPGEQTLRCVKVIGKRIYVGGDNVIGYYERDINGRFVFTSLMPLVKPLGLPADNFWGIATEGKYVYFHTYSYIVAYDCKRMSVVVKDRSTAGVFTVGERVFTQYSNGKELLEIKNGKLKKYPMPCTLTANVRFVGASSNGLLVVQEDGKVLAAPSWTERKTTWGRLHVDAAALQGNILMVGTIGDGIFQMNLSTGECRKLPASRLQDNNMHGLCFSSSDMLWAALDNGVSAIRIGKEDMLWKPYTEVGSFFDAARLGDNIYVSTNKGLYLYGDELRRVGGEILPLALCSMKGELLVGAMDAIYKITSTSSSPSLLSPVNGVSQFEYAASRGKECLFFTSYQGLGVMRYDSGTWQPCHIIDGGDNFSLIAAEDMHTLWGIHTEKGIFRLRLNGDQSCVTEKKRFDSIDGFELLNRISIFRADGCLFFVTKQGIYSYDPAKDTFVKHEALSKQIENLNQFINIRQADENRIWVITRRQLALYEIHDIQAKLLRIQPMEDDWLLEYNKHVNLRQVDNTLTFVSGNDGIRVIRSDESKAQTNQHGLLRVDQVRMRIDDDELTWLSNTDSVVSLPSDFREARVNVSTGLNSEDVYLRYRIHGYQDEWSFWSHSGAIVLYTMPVGSYTLEIQNSLGQTLTLQIKVCPPFYLSWWMLCVYLLLLSAVVALVVNHWNNRRHRNVIIAYEKEQRRLADEMKQQQMAALEEKAKSQQEELSARLRLLTQKQELLTNISAEIDRQKKELGERWPNKLYSRLVKIIDEGGSEMDRKLSMENYFVDVHHDFMLRMQERHPQLGASELKFCCLLRANLGTKEMAAIMGIGTRSVELRKYRLKQSLGLGKDEKLVNYILSI